MANEKDDPMHATDRLARLEKIMHMYFEHELKKTTDDKKAEPDTELLVKLGSILEKVSGNQAQTADLITQSQRQQIRPSNELPQNVSPFNPFGTLKWQGVWEKPKLRCEMHIPHRAEDDMLTIEEVQLLNLLVDAVLGQSETGSAPYYVTRTDGSRVKLTVKLQKDEVGNVSRLHWMHDTAFRNEYFRTMPPLNAAVRQMLSQGPSHIAKQALTTLTMDDWQTLEKAGTSPVPSAA